jgi:hypothetical protein
MTSAPWTTLAFCCATLAAAPALPQAAAERVASHNDWSVFVAGSPQECYVAAQPNASSAERDGQAVEVNRGDIRLFVRFNPSENVSNEVSFTGGYPFRPDAPVRVVVGDESYDLAPGQGDASGWAWPSPEDDARLVDTMRRGSTARVTGVSARGTTTVDTFSLSGFTAAVNDAESRCR